MTIFKAVIFANLAVLIISSVMFFTSEKINRDVISLENYSNCFDNFTEIVFCELKKGTLVNIEQIPKNATLIIGDSHGLVFADVVRNSLLNAKEVKNENKEYFFIGICSCLPANGYQHKVPERQQSCQTLGDIANNWEGDLIYAAKWLKYPNKFFPLLKSNALIIAQAPKFALPLSAIPTSNGNLSRIELSEYQRQQESYRHFFNLFFNPYENVLCDQNECTMTINGVALYSDEHHLSSKGTMEISKYAHDILQTIVTFLEG